MAAFGQEPFPHSIIKASGTAFAVGLIGSVPWYLIKGPSGARLSYWAMKAPLTAGSWAAWGCLFETMSGGLAHIRHKQNPWNNIWAGGLASGLLSWRMGLRSASTQFLMGGAILAGVEGLNIMWERVLAAQTLKPHDYYNKVLKAPQDSVPDLAETESSLFDGNKGGKTSNEEGGTKVSETSDTSPPAMPIFSESN